MRKMFCALLAAAIACGGSVGCSASGNGAEEEISEVRAEQLDGEYIRWYGRYFYDEEEENVFFSQSASGFEIRFRGEGLTASFGAVWSDGGSYNPVLAVSIDGEDDPRRFGEIVVDDTEEKEYTLAENLSAGTEHVVRVYKKSESAFGKLYLYSAKTDGVFLKKDRTERLKIEVFGDSITCGYGVDSLCGEGEQFSTLTENACETYAFLTARMLDAELSMLCASGWGMKEGLSPNTELPLWFEYADLNSDLPWDNRSHAADIVIITLGANDNQYILKGGTFMQDRIEAYKAAYKTFIEKIFTVYPKTKVICCYGFLNEGNVYAPISELALEFREKGKSVYDLQISSADSRPPLGLHGHPGKNSHIAAAEELVSFMESRRIAIRKKDNIQ